MSMALEHCRVLDLAGEPGLYATKLLADLGADVVRIDAPAAARDPRSSLSRDASGNGLVYFNTGKRSITLDLESPEGCTIFRRLTAGVDVVCETSPPGSLAERGIGYEEIAKLDPKIVWVSITPFGLSGPRRDWKGSNAVGWAVSGVPPATGDPDRAPLIPGGSLPLAYLLASLNAAVGALIALRARRRSGGGQLVDVSVHESVVAAACEVGVPGFLDDLIRRERYGPRRPVLAPSGLYRTTDGYGAVMIVSPAHWEALGRWIAEKTGIEAAVDPMFRDLMVRRENAELLDEWTEALTSQYSKQELFEEGQRRGISITPVNRIADVARDPQLRARGYWVEIEDPVLGRLVIPGAPYRLAKTPWRTSAAPLLGADNQAVYCTELGLAKEELDRLSASGVV